MPLDTTWFVEYFTKDQFDQSMKCVIGGFTDHTEAQRCLTALAGRSDVRSAIILPSDKLTVNLEHWNMTELRHG